MAAQLAASHRRSAVRSDRDKVAEPHREEPRAFVHGGGNRPGPGPRNASQVVQQKREEARPAERLAGLHLNDGSALGREADRIGEILSVPVHSPQPLATRDALPKPHTPRGGTGVVQRVLKLEGKSRRLQRNEVLDWLMDADYQILPGWGETIDGMIASWGTVRLAPGGQAAFVKRLDADLNARLTAVARPTGVLGRLWDGIKARWRKFRSPALGAEDRKEIENWVTGNPQRINEYARDPSMAQDPLVELMKNEGPEDSRFAHHFEERQQGLDRALGRLPKYGATTYRKAKGIGAYSERIRVGSLIGSEGYFATSRIKGAEGAAGSASWGAGEGHVYSEVRGGGGVELEHYQKALAGEREVLYPRHSVFRVLGLKHSGGAVTVILRHIPPDEVPNEPVLDAHTGNPILRRLIAGMDPRQQSQDVVIPIDAGHRAEDEREHFQDFGESDDERQSLL